MGGYLYGRFTINLGVYVAGMVIGGGESRSWVNHYNCQFRKRIGGLLTGVLIRSYLSQDLRPGHREGVERQLKAAGSGHLLDPA
jgi:hypothetical protein